MDALHTPAYHGSLQDHASNDARVTTSKAREALKREVLHSPAAMQETCDQTFDIPA